MPSLALTNGFAQLCDQLESFPKTVIHGEYTIYQVGPCIDGVNNVQVFISESDEQPEDMKLVLRMASPVYEAFASKLPVAVLEDGKLALDVSALIDSGTQYIVRATRYTYPSISMRGDPSVELAFSLLGQDMLVGAGSAIVKTFVDVAKN